VTLVLDERQELCDLEGRAAEDVCIPLVPYCPADQANKSVKASPGVLRHLLSAWQPPVLCWCEELKYRRVQKLEPDFTGTGTGTGTCQKQVTNSFCMLTAERA
jgi:hypothetical protein